jgi:hypothetical protein
MFTTCRSARPPFVVRVNAANGAAQPMEVFG